MKTKLPLMMVLFSILILFSCKKEYQVKENQDNPAGDNLLENVNFASDFNWETSRNVIIKLHSSEMRNFYIYSTDRETRYFHARHPGRDTEMKISLNLPLSVKSLRIADKEVNIASATINISLNQ